MTIKILFIEHQTRKGSAENKNAQASFHQEPICKISYLSNNQFTKNINYF